MKYVPIEGKSLALPVDNSGVILVLAMLALMDEQARSATPQWDDLPVIAF